MAHEDAVLTFFLKDAELVKSGDQYSGKATITARVKDTDAWAGAMEQLNGLEVYKGTDFKTELIRSLRGHKDTLEEEIERKDRDSHEALERLTQHFKAESAARVGAEQRIRMLEASLATKQSELDAMRSMVEELAALG